MFSEGWKRKLGSELGSKSPDHLGPLGSILAGLFISW